MNSPKPQSVLPIVQGPDGKYPTINKGDWPYIVHACNAYPKLVELMRQYIATDDLWSVLVSLDAKKLLKDLGEL